MTEQTIQTTNFTEAKTSWNTKYVDPRGWICQITIRAESGKELLDKAASALSYLQEAGCLPFGSNYSPKPENNNGNGSKVNGQSNHSLCPIHGVEMKRFEKDGRSWLSHKSGDGWCNGKPKNGR